MSAERNPGGAGQPPASTGGIPPASTTGGNPTAPPAEAGAAPPKRGRRGRRKDSENMLPQRERRRSRVESMLVRLIATCGIVAIGVAIGAIMVSNNSQGWLIGLVVSGVSVVLAAILWSSRQL
jgi:hypothetical protein